VGSAAPYEEIEFRMLKGYIGRLSRAIGKPFGYRPTKTLLVLGFVTSTEPTI